MVFIEVKVITTSPSHSPFLEQCVRVWGRILIRGRSPQKPSRDLLDPRPPPPSISITPPSSKRIQHLLKPPQIYIVALQVLAF